MRTRLSLMLFGALVCAAECVQVGPPQAPQFGRVEVSAVTILGDRVRNLSVDLIEIGSGKSFKSEFRDGVANRIPYGRYTARVYAPGFITIERALLLAQSEISLRTQLNVSMECGGGNGGVHGSIQPAPEDRELWVKIVPVLGAGGGEVRVSRTGTFQLEGLEEGDYLVLVLDGKSIIYSSTIGNGFVNIYLGRR